MSSSSKLRRKRDTTDWYTATAPGNSSAPSSDHGGVAAVSSTRILWSSSICSGMIFLIEFMMEVALPALPHNHPPPHTTSPSHIQPSLASSHPTIAPDHIYVPHFVFFLTVSSEAKANGRLVLTQRTMNEYTMILELETGTVNQVKRTGYRRRSPAKMLWQHPVAVCGRRRSAQPRRRCAQVR